MRILTLNTLKCPAKDVQKGYPLLLEVDDFEVNQTEFNQDFIVHLLPSLDWESIRIAAKAIGLDNSIVPEVYHEKLLQDLDFLKAIHYLLLDVHIVKGTMICPETGRRFPIENSIPNMILEESQV